MIDQRRLFVLSTAHLKRETAEAHNAYKEKGWLWPVPYGYICWLWDVEDCACVLDTCPKEISEAASYFRQKHQADSGDYIRFDCDGAEIPDLKTYLW